MAKKGNETMVPVKLARLIRGRKLSPREVLKLKNDDAPAADRQAILDRIIQSMSAHAEEVRRARAARRGN